MYERTQIKKAAVKAAAAIAAAAVLMPILPVAPCLPPVCAKPHASGAINKIMAEKNAVPQKPHMPERLIIAQDGSGDFTTIQEGVDYASDGDTLIICPGIYTENVEVMNKALNITGIDKEICVLQCDTAFYRKVPLTIAGGTVSNLTINGMNSGLEQAGPTEEEIAQINAELVGDSWERQKNYSGYAVHVDQNFLYQREVRFQNCRILSQNSHCAGIGSRGGGGIIFEDCELVSAGSGSCIFLHDPTSAEVGGTAKLVLRGCSLKSYYCPYVMTFQSLDPSNGLTLTFQNVRVSAVAYADTGSYWENNVNTGFDVETLASLEKMGALYQTGLTSSAVTGLVHQMTAKESHDYMEELEKALDAKDIFAVTAIDLPEGITYIGEPEDTPNPNAKRQVIAVYNYNGIPASGWCGLNNAYLTSDSYGNTLVEMNAILPIASFYNSLAQSFSEE